MLRTRGPAFSARAQASTAIEKQMHKHLKHNWKTIEQTTGTHLANSWTHNWKPIGKQVDKQLVKWKTIGNQLENSWKTIGKQLEHTSTQPQVSAAQA